MTAYVSVLLIRDMNDFSFYIILFRDYSGVEKMWQTFK